METEGAELPVNIPAGSPPVMPWRQFADWIGMSEDHGVVEMWIKRGFLPSIRIGKYRMVNIALFVKQLEAMDEI